MDDFFVTSQGDPSRFLQTLESLSSLSQSGRRNLQKRNVNESIDASLIKHAIELSTSSSTAQLFRKSGDADEALRAIWFAEFLSSAKSYCMQSSVGTFNGLSFGDLRTIAMLSRNEQSPMFIQEKLATEYGIVLILNRAYPGMKLDGVVTRLFGHVPAIALSIRYNRYNNFWFTLMHELSHVALHYRTLDNAIFDDLEIETVDDIETEANRYATDAIIPRVLFNKSQALRTNDPTAVFDLAKQAGVHVSLVAGALQHHKQNYKIYSDLVNSIDLRQMLGFDDEP